MTKREAAAGMAKIGIMTASYYVTHHKPGETLRQFIERMISSDRAADKETFEAFVQVAEMSLPTVQSSLS